MGTVGEDYYARLTGWITPKLMRRSCTPRRSSWTRIPAEKLEIHFGRQVAPEGFA